ncbi:VOC family protein [Saccharopolyspora sp. HNM0983]|uniref:VOC family protein n=1 Tax=Saccharopolyspora montiporae TaxID=2781240 RepID=A0A929B9P4_9PSEU|nr:VOC family protein [Saccharopolyspora sp. HNM0983]MBE9375857.1 VOC family protein [Saccharopolyspora sp. HNM0983]
MAVRSGFPILTTGDLGRLVDFYRAAFDAERAYGFAGEDGADEYVTLTVGGTSLGIGRGDAGMGSTHDRTALWFYVDDVDDAYRRALDAGATGQREPTDMPWGERVAQVHDPDGLVINLGAES